MEKNASYVWTDLKCSLYTGKTLYPQRKNYKGFFLKLNLPKFELKKIPNKGIGSGIDGQKTKHLGLPHLNLSAFRSPPTS